MATEFFFLIESPINLIDSLGGSGEIANLEKGVIIFTKIINNIFFFIYLVCSHTHIFFLQCR